MENSSRPTNAERREAARAQAAARRDAQLKRDSRNRMLMIVGIVVVVALAIAAVVMAVVSKKNEEGIGSAARPAIATEDGGISFAGPEKKAGSSIDGKPVVDVYFDYSCSACASFEYLHADDIKAMLDGGEANIVFHPVSILGSGFTGVAANAFYEVADRNPELALAFHEGLFGLYIEFAQTQDDSKMNMTGITAVATEVGVPQETIDAFAKNTYVELVNNATNNFVARSHSGELNPDKKAGTPTIVKDGKPGDFGQLMQPGGLAQWVRTDTYPTPAPEAAPEAAPSESAGN
ncbi:MAG: thioredoxin domain-containing protein [Buchananella hordeovulneris]|nr:thioredoxin domain-containing protein [Buchananella hordeovulneris]